jgi:hypothetical protein
MYNPLCQFCQYLIRRPSALLPLPQFNWVFLIGLTFILQGLPKLDEFCFGRVADLIADGFKLVVSDQITVPRDERELYLRCQREPRVFTNAPPSCIAAQSGDGGQFTQDGVSYANSYLIRRHSFAGTKRGRHASADHEASLFQSHQIQRFRNLL